MKVGIAGPVTLSMLSRYVKNGDQMPLGYLYSPMAYWIDALLKKGHQVTVFTLSPNIDIPQKFQGDQLTIHIGRYRSKHRARDFFKQEQQDLIYSIQKDPVDVIHAHWTYEFALASIKSGLPVLVTARDAPLEIFIQQPHPYRFIRLLLALQVCRLAKIITAVSSYIENHYRSVLLYKGQMPIIPNGIPEFVFNFSSLRKNYTPNTSNMIIFASNIMGWSSLKNPQTLIKAFAKVRKRFTNVEMWMFGKDYGPGEKAERWAIEKQIGDGIKFVGYLPHQHLLMQLTQHVDILVHPSRTESFSNAIAEAMALGIPVIGGKQSGAVPEVIGNAGLTVDVTNTSELADAMISLITNTTLYEELALRGKERARKLFYLPLVLSQYEDWYKKLYHP